MLYVFIEWTNDEVILVSLDALNRQPTNPLHTRETMLKKYLSITLQIIYINIYYILSGYDDEESERERDKTKKWLNEAVYRSHSHTYEA